MCAYVLLAVPHYKITIFHRLEDATNCKMRHYFMCH